MVESEQYKKRKIRKRVYRNKNKHYIRKGKTKQTINPKKGRIFRSSRKQNNQREKPQTKESMIKDYLIAKKEKVILADIISQYQQKIEKYKEQDNEEKVKEYQEKQDKMLQKIQKKEQVNFKNEQENISLSIPIRKRIQNAEEEKEPERENLLDIVDVQEEEIEQQKKEIEEQKKEMENKDRQHKKDLQRKLMIDLDKKFKDHMSEQEVQDYAYLINNQKQNWEEREQEAIDLMKNITNLSHKGPVGKQYKKFLMKDRGVLEEEEIKTLEAYVINPTNLNPQYRQEVNQFLKQMDLVKKGNKHFDEIVNLQRQIADLERNGQEEGNGEKEGNGMLLQTMSILINQLIYTNPQYSMSQQIILSFDQSIQNTGKELQIILFLTKLEDSRHYTVAVINKVKEPNEIVYYDPLAINKPEILKILKQAALQQFPDEYVKFKVNNVQIQDGEEPGLYKDSWYMCGQFCYLFLVEYLGANSCDPKKEGFDFKQATMYKGLSQEQKEKLKEISVQFDSDYRNGFSEL